MILCAFSVGTDIVLAFGFLWLLVLPSQEIYTCTLAPNARTDEPALPQTFQCDNLCLDRLGGSSANASAANFCLMAFKRRVTERKTCLMPRRAVQPCILCPDTSDDYCNPCILAWIHGRITANHPYFQLGLYSSRGFSVFHGMCEQLCLRGSTLRSVPSIHGPLGYGPTAADLVQIVRRHTFVCCCCCVDMKTRLLDAGVSQAGAWTELQLQGHGDTQRFNSSSLARLAIFLTS